MRELRELGLGARAPSALALGGEQLRGPGHALETLVGGMRLAVPAAGKGLPYFPNGPSKAGTYTRPRPQFNFAFQKPAKPTKKGRPRA